MKEKLGEDQEHSTLDHQCITEGFCMRISEFGKHLWDPRVWICIAYGVAPSYFIYHTIPNYITTRWHGGWEEGGFFLVVMNGWFFGIDG